MTLSASELNERRLLRGGWGVEGVDAAARAESRRRPARWAGFKPPILRSTSTIVVKLCWYLYVYRERWRREERVVRNGVRKGKV